MARSVCPQPDASFRKAQARRYTHPRAQGCIGPNEDAITRLVGAILLEQNAEWAVQRARYLTLETIAPSSDDPTVTLPTLQTDRSGPMPETTVTTPSYTTPWDTILPDYELLELLLFFAVAKIDTKPVAKQLLSRFGSLAGVVNASAEQLGEIERMDHFTIVLFKALRIFAARLIREDLTERPVLDKLGQADRLPSGRHGAQDDRAVPAVVSRPPERADRRRGAARRLHRPYAGLPARGREAGARARLSRGHGAQPPEQFSAAFETGYRDDPAGPRCARPCGDRPARSPDHLAPRAPVSDNWGCSKSKPAEHCLPHPGDAQAAQLAVVSTSRA